MHIPCLLIGWRLRGKVFSHWLVQMGIGQQEPPASLFLCVPNALTKKRACLNLTNTWLWRNTFRINMCFSTPPAESTVPTYRRGGGVAFLNAPWRQSCQCRTLRTQGGGVAGWRRYLSVRRRAVKAISLRTRARFAQGAAHQRVSFLEKRRGPKAECGMIGTCLIGRSSLPYLLSISKSPSILFSISFGSLSLGSQCNNPKRYYQSFAVLLDVLLKHGFPGRP